MVVSKQHLNCGRVGRERTRISKSLHNLCVDGKNDDSYEHSLKNDISKLFPVLRLQMLAWLNLLGKIIEIYDRTLLLTIL